MRGPLPVRARIRPRELCQAALDCEHRGRFCPQSAGQWGIARTIELRQRRPCQVASWMDRMTDHINQLQKERERLVATRREMAEAIATTASLSPDRAAAFTAIQEAINSVDEATRDETIHDDVKWRVPVGLIGTGDRACTLPSLGPRRRRPWYTSPSVHLQISSSRRQSFVSVSTFPYSGTPERLSVAQSGHSTWRSTCFRLRCS